jgi:hypothetical protein
VPCSPVPRCQVLGLGRPEARSAVGVPCGQLRMDWPLDRKEIGMSEQRKRHWRSSELRTRGLRCPRSCPDTSRSGLRGSNWVLTAFPTSAAAEHAYAQSAWPVSTRPLEHQKREIETSALVLLHGLAQTDARRARYFATDGRARSNAAGGSRPAGGAGRPVAAAGRACADGWPGACRLPSTMQQ